MFTLLYLNASPRRTSTSSALSHQFVDALDMEAPYLRNILWFMGLTDVASVVTVNQTRGPEQAEAGRAKAKADLQALPVSGSAAPRLGFPGNGARHPLN